MDIGNRIRELRKTQGLTQEELADRAELTKGFISQLERDMTSPSIATLEDILQCLGTTLSEFFREDKEEQIVFTEEDYFEKEDREYGNQITWIIPNAQKNSMEPICLTLDKNGSTYPDNPHEGEEFGYVLEGTVDIHIGRQVYHASKGDSFYYTADKPHFLSSKKGARLLWVTSPPSF
ncbi:MAG: helix-turn-helix domain-containing protein [Eubacterium sp.]|nr:helix-turn-helix domain-containing protein [Eubacterium sp.]